MPADPDRPSSSLDRRPDQRSGQPGQVPQSRPPGGSAAVRAAVDTVLAGLSTIEQEVLAAVTAEHPELATLPPEVTADIRAAVRTLLQQGLPMLASGDPFDQLGPQVAANALRRRDQGVPMVVSLALAEGATRRVTSRLVTELGAGDRKPASEDLSYIRRRILELVQTMSWHSVAVLGDGLPPDSRSPSGERARRSAELLALLLAGESREPDGVPGLAAQLGVTLPLDVVLALPGDVDQEELVGRLPGALVSVYEGRVVVLASELVALPVVLPAPAGPRGRAVVRDGDVGTALRRALRAQVVVEALSGQGDVSAGAPPDKASAGALLDKAEAGAVPDGAEPLELDGDEAVLLAAVVDLDDDDAQAAVRACFGALPETERGLELLETVAAALTWPQAARAARELRVHRHTFEYRLQRFTEATGQDLADPVVRLRCQLALITLRRWPYRA